MATKKKITCQSFLERVSEYIDGALEADLRVSLEAHLARCPDCWVVYDETSKTIEIFQNVECHPLPQEVHQRLLKALERNWKA